VLTTGDLERETNPLNKHLYALVIASIFVACAAPKTPLRLDKAGMESPPSDQRVLQLLLQNTDIALSNGAHCASAQTSPKDATLGDYFAGVWQHQTNANAENWLEISCLPVLRKERPHWQCDVATHSNEGEAFWGYGVRFHVDANTQQFDRDEFMCIGGG